ncbi:glycosyltransferase [Geotalea sp. SG265]|uniref:glycosyltransferase n=1 Tax=Geotalea sp. SG265 TaxID=2922867 RepID=UPI001FAFD7D5
MVILHDANRCRYWPGTAGYAHQMFLLSSTDDGGGIWIGSQDVQIDQLIKLRNFQEAKEFYRSVVAPTAGQRQRWPVEWDDIYASGIIKLYAGDLPDKTEYSGWTGLSITRCDLRHIPHDMTLPLPLPENSVDAFQSEDVFEHITYDRLPQVINEIHRILKPGGLFRLSLPDYRCDVMQARSLKDAAGNITFDPAGGGSPENPGHVWFPRYETVRNLLENSNFATAGEFNFLHYYDEQGQAVTNTIDYSKGFIQRTPDHDPRVRSPYRPMSLVIDLVKAKMPRINKVVKINPLNTVPVVLICYNRPWHTSMVLRALKDHNIQNLIIFSDAPKTESHVDGVRKTRQLLEDINWTQPEIIMQTENQGLAKSIVSATNYAFEKSDCLILLEDDCVPQKFFFDFMQKCLTKYANNERIFGISGYTVPIPERLLQEYSYDIYFYPRIGSWGWGTWKRAWQHYQPDFTALCNYALSKEIDLCRGGVDVPANILRFLQGELKDVWTLNWLLSVYINNGYYIYPTASHIDNIGCDGTGVHCGATDRFSTQFATKPAAFMPENIVFNEELIAHYNSYFGGSASPSSKRLSISTAITPQTSTQQNQLSILHINTHDHVGGAAKVAWRLAESQRAAGHKAHILAGFKHSDSPFTSSFDIDIDPVLQLRCQLEGQLFYEFQGSHRLTKHPLVQQAGLLNLHNLHGGYFNPFSLPSLSRLKPLVWTLHDMQALTGHCAHAFNCTRWMSGCGQCPDLTIEPALGIDSTAQLWHDKKLTYDHSRLHIVTPSLWLKQKVERSILKDHPVELIYNGVDTNTFYPHDKREARAFFGIPDDLLVIGAVAHGGTLSNQWKGGEFAQQILDGLWQEIPGFIFLNIGSDNKGSDPRCIYTGHITDEAILAKMYSCLDIFLYTPRADNCPLVVLEALACGVPIVALAVGGVPELVRHKAEGFVLESENVAEAVAALRELALTPSLRQYFSAAARERATSVFDHQHCVGQYERLYQKVMEEHREKRTKPRMRRTEVPAVVATKDFLAAENIIAPSTNTIGCESPLAGPNEIGASSQWPKISIVTPSYNQGEFLEACIQSVLSQNYPNLEYIIMDGGSTDGSVEIIKNYETYLTYWQSCSDGGQYQAINAGFQRANGEIMGWLNSDDKLHAGSLSLISRIFNSFKEVEWLTGRPTAWDDQGELKLVLDYLPIWSREKFLNRHDGESFIQQESTFWRRSLWEKAGSSLQAGLKFAADFELWGRFFRHAQLYTVDALVGGFRYQSRQKTANHMEEYLCEAQQVIEKEKFETAESLSPSLPAPIPITIANLAAKEKITDKNFSTFTYSQFAHFTYFRDYDFLLYGKKVDMHSCDLKTYQDLLVFTFIMDNVPQGARILEVGGGESRVLAALHKRYECWNLDKLEGIGNGLRMIKNNDYRLIRDYIGSFSSELPEKYFDLVFSISVLEHIVENKETWQAICRDLERIMAPGAYSLHCFDVAITKNGPWSNKLLPYLFQKFHTSNQFVPLTHPAQDHNTFYLSEKAYNVGWAHITGKSYEDFGKPLSYNILWKKNEECQNENRRKIPATIATSIAPVNIPLQQQAIASWQKLGFHVISVNSKEEIAIIGESFPGITFFEAHRDATAIIGKPLIYLDDVLKALDQCGADTCGIVNSDIHLAANDGFLEFICRETTDSFIFGARVEVESLDNLNGQVYPRGFDFFFLDRKLLQRYPSSTFCLGAPWWDYWAPFIPMAVGAPVKLLTTPVAFHLSHPIKWAEEIWTYYCRLYYASLPQLAQKSEIAEKLRISATTGDAGAFATEVLAQLTENAQVLEYPFSGGTTEQDLNSATSHGREMEESDQLNSAPGTSSPSEGSGSMILNEEGSSPETEANDIYRDVTPLIAAGRIDEAIVALSKLIHSYPHFALAHNDLGVIHSNRGEMDKALQHHEEAVHLDPLNTTFQKNLADLYQVAFGRTEEALQIYVRILAAQPKDVETLLGLGNICISANKLDDANCFFTRALEIEPWNAEVRQSLEALRRFSKKAQIIEPPDEMHRKALSLAAANSDDEAIAMLEKLLQNYPQFAVAYNDLGVLYSDRGETEKALLNYEKAGRIEPTNITFQKNLADFYNMVMGRTEEALQIYLWILAVQPKDVETLLALGNICIPLDRLDDADYFFNRALEVEPWNREAQESLSALKRHRTTAPSPPPTTTQQILQPTAHRQPIGSRPLVSAIVSTYNAQRFIGGCLENLEAQTIADRLEIIVVDSGSQENEHGIVREFQARYDNIRYIRTEERETVYQAWNRGIRAASGVYITNANTDDRHRRDALGKLAATLDAHGDVDLVYGDIFITYDPDLPFAEAMQAETVRRPDFSPEMMLSGCHMGPQPMWRATVHETAGYFNEAYRSAGDYEFWCRMALAHGMKMLHLPEVLGCYYFNRNGVEISNFDLSGAETATIKETYAALLTKQDRQKRPEQPIDIIFLTYNRPSYFQQALNALIANTRYPYRLIVVDNHSNDEMATYLQQVSIFFDHLIVNDDNYFTTAFRRGIQVATSDPYVVSDPDILVPDLQGKCWLEQLVEMHHRYPEMGLIALNLDPANKPTQLPEVYLGDKEIYNEEITLANVGTVMQSIKRRFFDGGYITDWETCQQIRKKGGKVGFATNIQAYHLGWNEDSDYPDYLVEKYHLFKDKFGSDLYSMYTDSAEILARMGEKPAAYYGFSRPEVQELVSPKAKRILDVGCAAGTMGGELKEKLQAEVWGIECQPEAAGLAAKKLDKLLTGTVEEKLAKVPDGYFDTIIFADVLEHLRDPAAILSAARAKLAAGGEIVASIPNVRHWSVVKGLLEGEWDYTDEGILDRTHLRFFTRQGVMELFGNAGFTPTTMSATVLNEVQVPPQIPKALAEAGLDVSTLADEGRHYQYLLRAVPQQARQAKPVFLPPAKEDKPAQVKVAAETSALTSIIILTFNQLEYTRECLSSIQKHTPENHEVIFVDNGSKDGTVKWLRQQMKSHKNYRLMENKKNLGFAKGCNQGIAAAKGDYLLLLNNDVVVTEGWLTGMLECLEASAEYGIVGPMTNNIAGPQQLLSVPYANMDEMQAFAAGFRSAHRHRRIPVKLAVGFCMLARRSLADKVGMLDEAFALGNFEDDDFCLRASMAGLQSVIAGDVFIHHHGSRTFEGNKIDFKAAMAANRKVFDRKWDLTKMDKAEAFRLAAHNARIKGEERFLAGDLDQAVKILLEEGIKFAPADHRPYRLLAGFLMEAKRYTDALAIVKEMPGSEQDGESLVLEGLCREGLDQLAEAAACADRALAMNGSFAPALNLKGVLAFRNDDRAGAERLFKAAMAADPGFGEAYTNLGVLRWSAGAHDEALELLEMGFVLNPAGGDAMDRYHTAITACEAFSRGEAAFREARALFPACRMLAFKLIDLLLSQERDEEAMAEIEQAMVRFGADDGIVDAALQIRARLDERKEPQGGKGGISLCMIAKDEAAHIARALNSVKPLVDEMIVVDTGSSDRTGDIARAFGATVFNTPWPGSFAKARNESLAKAAGKWILVLDADEVISASDHELLRKLATGKPAGYALCQKNYTNLTNTKGWQPHDGQYPKEEAGTGFQPNHIVRFFPNDGRVRFENPVHELVEPSLRRAGIPVQQIDLPIHHYGKLDKEKLRKKWEFYYELGKKKLAEQGSDVIALSELAIQAAELGRYDESLDLWRQVTALEPDLSQAHFNMGYAYLCLGRYSEALKASKKAMELDPQLKEAVFNYGCCELYAGEIGSLVPLLENLLARHPGYPSALALLASVHLCQGEGKEGKQRLQQVRELNYDCGDFLFQHAKVLYAQGRFDWSRRLLEAAVDNGAVTTEITRLLAECTRRAA